MKYLNLQKVNPNEQSKEKNRIADYNDVVNELRNTYIKKNNDYGNSFEKSLDEFGILASVVRVGDKFERMKSLIKRESLVEDESFRDTVLDMSNYLIMTAMWLKNNENVYN